MLDELLELDRGHDGARNLRDKISRYYVMHGDRKIIDFGGGVTGEFVFIGPGEFLMGSPASEEMREDDETQHRVKLTKGYWIGTTEVTQAQWQVVMGNNPSDFTGDDRRPVEQVSWNDIQEYCRKLSERSGLAFRLPTEAEWEYACRAGTTTPFNTGTTISTDQSNYHGEWAYGAGRKGTYRQKTTIVMSFAPNAWGLYGMHGNVREWCQDWSSEYPSGLATDPKGPSTGQDRVMRGGCWNYPPWSCRSAIRFNLSPDISSSVLGFRLTLDPS